MSCPNGFQVNPSNGTTCIVRCPDEKGFETAVVNGVPVCRYKNDNRISVTLNPLFPMLRVAGQSNEPNSDYKQAQENFEKDFAVAFAQIGKQKQIDDAFQELQAAENARDQSPQAYQDARIRYYTLLKGDTWVDEEKERITNSEVAPKIIQYMNSYRDMSTRIQQQQQTLDVVKNVKDKVLSMKDEFAYATNTFAKQIDELKSQINIERKQRKEEKKSWIDVILNILIVVFAIVAIIVLFKRAFKQSAYTQSPVYY